MKKDLLRLLCSALVLLALTLPAVSCKKKDDATQLPGTWQLHAFSFSARTYNKSTLDTTFATDEQYNYDTTFCTLTFLTDSVYTFINGDYTGGRYTAREGLLLTSPAYFGGYLFDSATYTLSSGELRMHRNFSLDQGAQKYISSSDWTFKR